MKASNKSITILIGVIVAIFILISLTPDPEVARFVDHKGDFPIGTFNMPTHLVKIP